MNQKDNRNLSNQLFFSKEAASYLGITTQRLSTLVKQGKITPLKKSQSGMIFHIDELNKRLEEQRIFTTTYQGGEIGMFQFDTCEKIEALNFATLMNALDMTEQHLEPKFMSFASNVDVSIFLDDEKVINDYVSFFHVDKARLKKEFDLAKKKFLQLKENDEIIKRGSLDYPYLLASTLQAPLFLYVRGKKSLLSEKRTVALVGSRLASEQSKLNTRKLAVKLGENGITIISGLAKGIDVEAHKAALQSGFNTIAVIGTNLNQYYPYENKDVQKEIEQKGLVVSQFSPATQTQRWFFPLRNGVMSGLSLATIIMEAGETSGALKQADFALKQNREVIIPKSALEIKTISWPAKYVEKGAKVFTNSQEVLKYLADSHIFNVKEEQTTLEEFFQDSNDQQHSKSLWNSQIINGE